MNTPEQRAADALTGAYVLAFTADRDWHFETLDQATAEALAACDFEADFDPDAVVQHARAVRAQIESMLLEVRTLQRRIENLQAILSTLGAVGVESADVTSARRAALAAETRRGAA